MQKRLRDMASEVRPVIMRGNEVCSLGERIAEHSFPVEMEGKATVPRPLPFCLRNGGGVSRGGKWEKCEAQEYFTGRPWRAHASSQCFLVNVYVDKNYNLHP